MAQVCRRIPAGRAREPSFALARRGWHRAHSSPWVLISPQSFCNRHGLGKDAKRSPPFVTASAGAASNSCWFRPGADAGFSPKAASNPASRTPSPLPSRLLKRLVFMAGWNKFPLPVTFAANLVAKLLKTRGLSPDLPSQSWRSLLTFAKCLGSNCRRNRTETPPGFPLKKRSSACSKTARRDLAPNSRASSTAPRPAFGDCTEAPTPDQFTPGWVTIPGWVTPGWVTANWFTPGKTLCKKFDSRPPN